jgi:hypothetical protein
MKKLFILAVLFLLGVLTAGSMYAQSGNGIKADIPFAFTVVDQTFLAGEYSAKQFSDTPLVLLRGAENSSAMAMSYGIGGGQNFNVEPKLVFRRYGEQYFLAQVWMGAGNAVAREIPKSSKERQVARSTFEPELISIAAK